MHWNCVKYWCVVMELCYEGLCHEEKKQVLIMEISKAFLCGKLILISHPAERYNVTFGFSRIQS